MHTSGASRTKVETRQRDRRGGGVAAGAGQAGRKKPRRPADHRALSQWGDYVVLTAFRKETKASFIHRLLD